MVIDMETLMSAPFAKAIARYKAEDVSGAIAALDPLLRSGKPLPFEVLLLAAQCFTKAEL
ncbi:hypothetical protein BJF93_03470 [Xaviernesmea oryzae]|uniref:Uncharacterized protein n=2 Tax=Xaviernesmea oryzae TaxID=464029 RepID=A0A1Q9AZK7_9HYPH|nr:hypothetical protein BJF93_03470 [Xaviernesmea oryzae]SEL12686.1 hypothetical protein SAMN04487976_10613 [Xaviernesmea oryzae]